MDRVAKDRKLAAQRLEKINTVLQALEDPMVAILVEEDSRWLHDRHNHKPVLRSSPYKAPLVASLERKMDWFVFDFLRYRGYLEEVTPGSGRWFLKPDSPTMLLSSDPGPIDFN